MSCALVAVAAVAAGCSGGGSKGAPPSTPEPTVVITAPATTTTTIPRADLDRFLKTFFAAEGKRLLDFERATPELANGKVPAIAVCRKYIQQILPTIGQPGALQVLAAKIPDGALTKLFHDDIGGKDLLLAACDTGQRPPQSAADQIHEFQVKLKDGLAEYGYSF